MKDVNAIYFSARELPEDERPAYLTRSCGGDDELRARVEQMLAVADEAEAFFALTLPDAEWNDLRQGPDPFDTSKRDPEGAPGEIIGQSIGRYKILERVGEGGCGVVYVAEQTQPVRRRVALKVIKLGMDTKQVVARFEAERQALAMMDHPNIAKVLDADTTELGRPYFVMELVRGIPITDYCDQAGLTTRMRLKLFIKVCQAVQHAHQKGIIHRDIKPSNILVTLHDGEPVPKVIDFGIAKATQGPLTNHTVYTQLHQFIGTPAYMSPEQAEMSGLDIDTRSDIYSLGVLLYELLAGCTPFDAADLVCRGVDAMRRTIREQEPPRPSTRLSTLGADQLTTTATRRSVDNAKLLRQLRGDLDWIVMKCLEKDRRRRYETVNGLAADVRRHLNNEPVAAGPPSKVYALKRLVARNKGAAILLATITVLTLAGLLGTSIGLGRATAARVRADETAARERQASEQARKAEASARAAEAAARRQAYAVSMLGVSDAMENARIDTARLYLDRAPEPLRGWEWRHFSSRLDLSVSAHQYPRADHARAHVLPDGQSYYEVITKPAGGIQRRDIHTGNLLGSLPTTKAYCGSRLMADGKRLIAQVHNGRDTPPEGYGDIELWDLEHETLLASWAAGLMTAGAPDGSQVACMVEGNELVLLDLMTGSRRPCPRPPYGQAMCFDPEGRLLAYAVSWEEIALLDTGSLQLVATFKAHDNSVSCMAFSPDGRWLATGSFDKTIRITDVTADPPAEVVRLRGHSDWVSGLCFSPDGSRLASSGWDRSLRLWDPQTGACENVLLTDRPAHSDPVILPDGHTLLFGDSEGIRFWDVSLLDASILRGHSSYVYPVLLSPDGGTVYSGGWDGFKGKPGSLRFWDTATGDEIGATVTKDTYVCAAALSADGSRLAISLRGADGTFNRADILDTATGKAVASVTDLLEDDRTPGLFSLTFDAAGKNLIWVDHIHGMLHVADARTGLIRKSQTVFLGRGDWSNGSCVACSPDGVTIALTTPDNNTLLLDARSLELVRQWPNGHAARVSSVAFSPDSRRVLTASEDGTVRVWEAATGTRIGDLVGHASRVWCAAYSPDGKRIASGGSDHNVRIWDAETFEQVARLSGHDDYVYSLVWRADSQRLISGSGDGTVRIWDTQPLIGRRKARLERADTLAQVEPLVQRLFSETEDGDEVVARIKGDPTLATRTRQVALQVALQLSIEQRKVAARSPAPPTDQ